MGNHILKIYSGSYLPPNATHHVCTTHPVPGGGNFESVCATCGNPIFFQDQILPNLKKICIPCYFQKIKAGEVVESVGNVDSIIKAILAGKQN